MSVSRPSRKTIVTLFVSFLAVVFLPSLKALVHVGVVPPSEKLAIDAVSAATPIADESKKVTIGVLTNLEKRYVDHLMGHVGRKPNRGIKELTEPIACVKLNPDIAAFLGRTYLIDMIICVDGSGFNSQKPKAHTRLVNIRKRRMKVFPEVGLETHPEPDMDWEKLVETQISHIEQMIREIEREESTPE
jgi:hypothetical protein